LAVGPETNGEIPHLEHGAGACLRFNGLHGRKALR
jgi:hypothetical protein